MEKNIAIIAAMEDVELDYLKSKLENLKEVNYKSFKFFEGKINNKNIILCKSNIGLINAGIATTILIEKYSPYCIINEGLARRIH